MACCADDESRKKLGAYLVQTQFQGSVNSSAMFLTAAAQNLLCMKLAGELGVTIGSAWVTWFKVGLQGPLARLAGRGGVLLQCVGGCLVTIGRWLGGWMAGELMVT